MKKIFSSILLLLITNCLYSSNISLQPAFANSGESISLNIKISNFGFTAKGNKVVFLNRRMPTEYITVGNVTRVDSFNLKAEVSLGSQIYLGYYSLLLINGNNDSMVCINCFMVYGQYYALVSVSPNMAAPNESLKIVIKGTKTHFKSNIPSFRFSLAAQSGFYQININSVKVINDSVCEAQIYIEEVIKGDLPQYCDLEYFMPGEYTDMYDAFQITSNTGVNDIALARNKCDIFPIPFSGEFNIQSEELIKGVSVYNLQSQLEFQINNLTGNNGIYHFGDINLPKGVYIIKIETDKGIEIKKVSSY